MSNKDTGGLAFPQPINAHEYGRGMTLRDYFAAKAMQADMADGIHENDFAWSAARAYKMANAMLEARKQ